MENRPDSRPRRRRPGAFALAALVAGAGLVASVVIMSALGAMPVSAAPTTSCDSSGSPVTVHYEIAGGYPGSASGFAVSGVVLSNFPADCDGATVTLAMWGNSAGDPSVVPSSDKLLSTADSTLDPCSQKSLSTPLVVTNESITLSLCATGGPAGYASVHDLTLLTLFVPATSGGALGASTSNSPAGTVVPTPVTGAAPSLASDLLALGIALLLAGAVVYASGARRWHGTN
jgi:hypothetical protein